MDDDQLKQQKLEELKAQYLQQKSQEEANAQAEMKLDSMLRQILTEEAKSRLSNIKLVNKEQYAKALQAIMYLYQSGRVKGKLTDTELKELLVKMKSDRDISIKRK